MTLGDGEVCWGLLPPAPAQVGGRVWPRARGFGVCVGGVGDKIPNSWGASGARCSRKLGLRVPSCRGSIWPSCLCLSKDRSHLEGRAWVA